MCRNFWPRGVLSSFCLCPPTAGAGASCAPPTISPLSGCVVPQLEGLWMSWHSGLRISWMDLFPHPPGTSLCPGATGEVLAAKDTYLHRNKQSGLRVLGLHLCVCSLLLGSLVQPPHSPSTLSQGNHFHRKGRISASFSFIISFYHNRVAMSRSHFTGSFCLNSPLFYLFPPEWPADPVSVDPKIKTNTSNSKITYRHIRNSSKYLSWCF